MRSSSGIDDSYLNCVTAKAIGWTAAHLVEEGLPSPEEPASQYQIESILELPDIYPQFFKSRATS
jgi:pyrimidine and pyridine-specific 5'-nucleotidase